MSDDIIEVALVGLSAADAKLVSPEVDFVGRHLEARIKAEIVGVKVAEGKVFFSVRLCPESFKAVDVIINGRSLRTEVCLRKLGGKHVVQG